MTGSRRVRFLAQVIGATAFALATEVAWAGAFSVSPVRIFMQARDRAIAVTVVNEGDSELVMQAEVFQWKQKPDGTDDLTPTDDLILAPPILKVPARSRQVVRLANLKPPPTGTQQTYRLIVREVPEALQPAQPGVQIQVALAFSLPIFITPPSAKRAIACQAQRVSDTRVLAVCENQGQAYAQPVSFSLTSASGEAVTAADVRAGYILPNMKRSFEMGGATRIPRGPAKLTVTQDDGSKQVFDVQLAE